jgi:hypothetical protein
MAVLRHFSAGRVALDLRKARFKEVTLFFL